MRRALLALEQRRKQIEVAHLVAKKGLSVRETEALVRRLQAPPGANGRATAPARAIRTSRRLEQDLAEKLGARVAIQHGSGGKGKLVVELQQPGRARRDPRAHPVAARRRSLYNPAAFSAAGHVSD